MAKKNKNKNKDLLEEKVAPLGKFVEEKAEEEIPEEEFQEEIPTEEVEEVKKTTYDPQTIRKIIVKIVGDFSSRGLTEEEKVEFLKQFDDLNGILYAILNMDENLRAIKPISLNPTQAIFLYVGGTITSAILLRSLIMKKPAKTTEKPEEKKEEKPEEIKIEEVGKKE